MFARLLSFWRGHTTVAIIVAAIVVLAACGGALWLVDATGQQLISSVERDAAAGELDLYAEMRREEGASTLVRAIARHARVEGTHHVYAVADIHGALLAGNLTAWPAMADTQWAAMPTEAGPTAIHVSVRTLPDGTRLLAGRDNHLHEEFNNAVLRAAWLAVAIVAATSLLAPAAAMALTMRRVRELSTTAALIAAGRFSARTPVHGNTGPFDRIAEAQNAMLDRIEDLVTGLKTVTDSLAHDLRTPLARLRARLEGGIAAPGIEAKQAALEAGLRETEKTIFAFSSLIDIARAEGGLSREAMAPVDLAALLRDVHELFLPLAEEGGLSLDLAAEECQILGHRPLLMQAIGNLAHNAIKHSPPGSRVTLSLTHTANQARIIVGDRGAGIPAEKRADAVKRFQKLGTGDTPEGVGLGLAIVEACARLHRGALSLEDNNPGLRAVLTLEADEPQRSLARAPASATAS